MIEGFVLHFGNLNYWFDLRYSCLFHSSIYRWVFKEKKKILPGKKKKNWKLKIKVFWQKLKRIFFKGFLENTSPKIKLKIKSVEKIKSCMIVGRKASQNFSFESTHKVSLNREFSNFFAFKFRLKILWIIYENNLKTSNESQSFL